ncbi:MAG: NAD-dependent epimerase/dehydratase family protein [Actinomycetes bacterium]
MARCLVVGANGFIGSHLVDALVRRDHEVTAFDRFATARPSFTSRTVRLVAGDFMNRADMAGALEGQEVVFHFLSTTDPATAENDPTFDVRTNVASTVEMLKLSVDAGVDKVVFASTGGAIYGDQDKLVFSEDDPTLPVSPYAIGKLSIENYLRYFRVKWGLDYLVFRISNPYGTRQRPHKKQGVVPIFLREIAKGEPITVFGDGEMVRDYIYVEDLVEMIAGTAPAPTRHRLYNLGSGEGRTINQIVDAIRAVTGRAVEVVHRPTPRTYVDHVILDASRFTDEFGLRATTSLHEGISKLWTETQEQRHVG